MRKLLAMSILAAGAIITGSAHAADLPARTYTKAPAYVSPAYNWSGFYLGLHAGYGWGDLDAGALGSTDQTGGLVGGQIGVNWQAPGSAWVLGLELDSAWADITDSETATVGAVTVTAESKTNYLGSLRGRVGYAWDRALLYATGGLGWAHNELSASVAVPGVIVSGSSSNTHFGYTVGAGLEYALAGPWSIKGEYLYYGLGSENYGGLDADLTLQTVKLGVNYRFGGY